MEEDEGYCNQSTYPFDTAEIIHPTDAQVLGESKPAEEAEPCSGSDDLEKSNTDAKFQVPNSFVRITYDDLRFCECCGQGTFGSVYRAHWTSQADKEVAVKKLNNMDKEAHVLSVLSHRNIIQFFGACADPPNFCIVTEYAPYGCLFDFLATSESDKIEFNQLLSWSRDIGLGMNYLHEEAPVTVIHRDLKSKNVVICEDFTLKICDFGASRFFGDTVIMTITGTYPWMAPELIQGLPTSELCDVYSFGVVLWELLTREVPFKGLQGFQVAWVVVEKQERPPIPESCPRGFADLMRRCWTSDVTSRPTFYEIIGDLNTMMNDDELGENTNNFIAAKEKWKGEMEERMAAMKRQEEEIGMKEEELAERAARLKEWEEKLKEQMRRQTLIGVAKYSKKSENLNCKIEGTGEGAINSVKDVLSHIMSKSNMNQDQPHSSRFPTSPIFDSDSFSKASSPQHQWPLSRQGSQSSQASNASSNSLQPGGSSNRFRPISRLSDSGLRKSPLSPLSLPQRGSESRPEPHIESEIKFDKSDINKSFDIFSKPTFTGNDFQEFTDPKASEQRPGEQDFTGVPLWGKKSAPNGFPRNKVQKQVSTSSEEYNFEGSKMSRSTAGSDGPEGVSREPQTQTWESAKGDAKVNHTNENFEYDPTEEVPTPSRPPPPSMRKLKTHNSTPNLFSNMSSKRPPAASTLPSEDDIQEALKSIAKSHDMSMDPSFAKQLSEALQQIHNAKQHKRTAADPAAVFGSADASGGNSKNHVRNTLPSALKFQMLKRRPWESMDESTTKDDICSMSDTSSITESSRSISSNSQLTERQAVTDVSALGEKDGLTTDAVANSISSSRNQEKRSETKTENSSVINKRKSSLIDSRDQMGMMASEVSNNVSSSRSEVRSSEMKSANTSSIKQRKSSLKDARAFVDQVGMAGGSATESRSEMKNSETKSENASSQRRSTTMKSSKPANRSRDFNGEQTSESNVSSEKTTSKSHRRSSRSHDSHSSAMSTMTPIVSTIAKRDWGGTTKPDTSSKSIQVSSSSVNDAGRSINAARKNAVALKSTFAQTDSDESQRSTQTQTEGSNLCLQCYSTSKTDKVDFRIQDAPTRDEEPARSPPVEHDYTDFRVDDVTRPCSAPNPTSAKRSTDSSSMDTGSKIEDSKDLDAMTRPQRQRAILDHYYNLYCRPKHGDIALPDAQSKCVDGERNDPQPGYYRGGFLRNRRSVLPSYYRRYFSDTGMENRSSYDNASDGIAIPTTVVPSSPEPQPPSRNILWKRSMSTPEVSAWKDTVSWLEEERFFHSPSPVRSDSKLRRKKKPDMMEQRPVLGADDVGDVLFLRSSSASPANSWLPTPSVDSGCCDESRYSGSESPLSSGPPSLYNAYGSVSGIHHNRDPRKATENLATRPPISCVSPPAVVTDRDDETGTPISRGKQPRRFSKDAPKSRINSSPKPSRNSAPVQSHTQSKKTASPSGASVSSAKGERKKQLTSLNKRFIAGAKIILGEEGGKSSRRYVNGATKDPPSRAPPRPRSRTSVNKVTLIPNQRQTPSPEASVSSTRKKEVKERTHDPGSSSSSGTTSRRVSLPCRFSSEVKFAGNKKPRKYVNQQPHESVALSPSDEASRVRNDLRKSQWRSPSSQLARTSPDVDAFASSGRSSQVTSPESCNQSDIYETDDYTYIIRPRGRGRCHIPGVK